MAAAALDQMREAASPQLSMRSTRTTYSVPLAEDLRRERLVTTLDPAIANNVVVLRAHVVAVAWGLVPALQVCVWSEPRG